MAQAVRSTDLPSDAIQVATRRVLPGWIVTGGAVLVVGAAAAAPVLARINDSFWADELWSLGIARSPLHVLWSTYLWGPESNMALYYVLLRGWLAATSWIGLPASEWVVRLPSLAFSVLAALAVLALGWRLHANRVVGVVAGLLFALNPLVLDAAGDNARAYSLALLLVTLSWLALFAIMDEGHLSRSAAWRWRALYVAATALAVYAHEIAVLVFFGQAIMVAALVVSGLRRRQPLPGWLPGWIGSVGASAVLAAPLALDVKGHGANNVWVWPVGPSDVIHLLGHMTGQQPAFLLALLGAGGVAFVVGVLPQQWTGLKPAEKREPSAPSWSVPALGLLCWGLTPVVITYVLTQPSLNLHLFNPRYLVLVVPAVCLLAGLGVAELRPRSLMAGGAVGLVALALIATIGAPAISAPREDLRGAAAWVTAKASPGDGVIPLTWGAAMALDEYAPALTTPGTPGRMDWSTGGASPVEESQLASFVAGRHRVFLVEDADNAEVASARAWFEGHNYRLIAQHEASGAYGPVVVLEYQAGP
ncbi:MAG TPA: hypothetical protein VGT01_01405 [Candidatus Dormibacteraeota bacterium]|nr:hypothetical protein [Candidatus Dormibacteraeota bacterium]